MADVSLRVMAYGICIIVDEFYDNPYVIHYFQRHFFLDSVYTEGKAYLLCGSKYFLNSFSVCYPISSQLHALGMLLQRKKYLLYFFVISYNSS